MGIHIRAVRLLVALSTLFVSLFASYFIVLSEPVLCDQDSGIVDLGSGSRPVYRIGYSGGGVTDIDELIDLAHKSSFDETPLDDSVSTAQPGVSNQDSAVKDLDSTSQEYAAIKPVSDDENPISQNDLESLNLATDGSGGENTDLNAKEEEYKADYVQIPIVSEPPGAEVYIDGMFYGTTPLIAIVELDNHLIESHLDGYWDWFSILDANSRSRTVPIVFVPLPAENSTTTEVGLLPPSDPPLDNLQADFSSSESGPSSPTASSTEAKKAKNETAISVKDDFLDQNYRKILMMVALLSFLVGSGSVATWARSRLTTSIKINFPRDGEDRWAGLIEGQSNRVYGTKRMIYVLVRYDDDKLQLRKRVTPNRDGRWSTRCEMEEGTIYRIYAMVSDESMTEGEYIDEIPPHRDISEVGPITGKKRMADVRPLPDGDSMSI